MAELRTRVDYEPFNASPPGVAETTQPRGLGPHFEVRASPEEMGGLLAQGEKQAAQGLDDAGKSSMQVAMQAQGMYNEAAATHADADAASQVGDVLSNYYSMSGLNAVNAAPQVKQKIQDIYTQAAANLPGGAARSFEMMTARQVANHIVDIDTHSAQQLRGAQRSAGLSLVNVNSAMSPAVATDDARFGENIGNIKHGVGMQMQDDIGRFLNPNDDGTTSFNTSTPEGKAAQQTYQNNVDTAVGQAWVNRFNTLSQIPYVGPINSWQKFQQEKDNIPPIAAAHIEASLVPQVYQQHVNQAFVNGWNQVQNDYVDHLTNPPREDNIADAIHKFGEGGALTSTTSVNGAMGGWQILPATFAQYAKPGEDINNPADNEAVGRRIVADYEKRWPDDPSRVAVAYFSGPGNVAPPGSATPWVNNSKDGNGTSVSDYVGKVMNGLSGDHNAPYATNADGSMMSQADYLASHRTEVLSAWDDWAQKQMPGDIEFRNQVRERANQQIDNAIKDQTARRNQDKLYIMKGITGSLSNGQVPDSMTSLQQLPNMQGVMQRVMAEDPKYFDGIDRMLQMANRGVTDHNSTNAYDTIQRVLEPSGISPNAIQNQAQLDSLLGKTDGTGINMKDYKDAKSAIEIDPDFKKFLAKQMKIVANASGNVDGQGQVRAVAWYNQAMQAWAANEKKGDSALSPSQLQDQILNGQQQHMPGLMDQISNWVKNQLGASGTQQSIPAPTATGANGEKYILQNGAWIKQ